MYTRQQLASNLANYLLEHAVYKRRLAGYVAKQEKDGGDSSS
jgi:hypothetical protein